ncbi:MerR family transcriptional regulator [Maledivibacter halophilus]|uniref:Predicted transcriptional regulators n=1 Tax=Maledivibacter halophilus TaxID=36842 RepID=A0A1T5LAU2_9FIRM|nr:MerR family transcriptional regulator [Maledivibacter halophilus]SKC73014.1 Predicted transcriptional regulators [Maledivibacter halophilus]
MIDVNKSYTISEASELIGFPNHVLRYYEKEFDLEIPRNKSGHRYFTYVEVEKYIYIKTLKERGLSNKQIKTVLNSPEELMNMNEVAATVLDTGAAMVKDIVPLNNLENDYSKNIQEIGNMIGEKMEDNFKDLSSTLVRELKDTLDDFKDDYKNNDKDALISENARLKMKLKERAYETAMLKEKLKRSEKRKGSIFKRLFTDTKNEI